MKFMADESADKLRGGYYTDPAIAAYLTRWIMEIAPSSVLEPSCGDGVFISELMRRSQSGSRVKVTAFEIDEPEGRKHAGAFEEWRNSRTC